jgi:hypothetical protein
VKLRHVPARSLTPANLPFPAKAQPFGEKPSGRSSVGKERVREVSAYLTACRELAREAACRRSPGHSIGYRLKMTQVEKPRIRKTYDLPLSPQLPTASRQLQIIQFDRRCLKLNSSSRYATRSAHSLKDPSPRSASVAVGHSAPISLFKANETRASRLRNFDTKVRHPYRYRSYSDNRLESVANAHTAADLHVRPEP